MKCALLRPQDGRGAAPKKQYHLMVLATPKSFGEGEDGADWYDHLIVIFDSKALMSHL